MLDNTRNFCIIAHIDHGKSTLADRFLELTETISKNKMQDQFLDSMDLERERGITIKMQPVRMIWKSQIKNSNFILNLIDTPGHMDFSYEVERSLAAVEGAILLIDASKGIQAQTLANLKLAQKQNLKIIPVLNKIDLPVAQENIPTIKQEIQKLLNEPEVLTISAKQGTGIQEVLEKIIQKIPSPRKSSLGKPFKALIFDSIYDKYKGVIAYIRVLNGQIKKGEAVKLLNIQKETEIIETGYFAPDLIEKEQIKAGDIAYVATGLKNSQTVRVGETIVAKNNQATSPIPGYREPEPFVFAHIFPTTMKSFPQLKDSLEKLHLNDFSFYYAPINHPVLGRGFKAGFLGMLHLEIVFERLKREYDTKIMLTSPSVIYHVITNQDNKIEISSAQEMPDLNNIKMIKEPWVDLEVLSPIKYTSKIHELLSQSRGEFQDTQIFSTKETFIRYYVPLAEIIEDFLNQLKSISQGFASFSYKPLDYRKVDLVKLDFAIVNEVKPSLSKLVPQKKAYQIARSFLSRLKNNLPQQQFAQALQAKIGSKVIAREDISAARKDVTAALYGGDFTRKKKLLVKQRKGKKKLLKKASVRIPEEVYLKVLKKK
jgi:GTP-binding protein LepA